MSKWSKEAEPVASYLIEMLKSKTNVYGGVATVAAAAIVSIPLGGPAAVIPVLGYMAANSIASLFIPSSPFFRQLIDRKKRTEQREGVRVHLSDEIVRRIGREHALWSAYYRLIERKTSLERSAKERPGSISTDDVDRLDDVTVDFLGLWLGRIAIQERSQTFSEKEIEKRIRDADANLATATQEADQRRWSKTKHDFETLLQKRREMRSRDAAAEAQMMTMVDTFDELYQRVMSGGSSKENSVELSSSIEKMNIEEELDSALYAEVETMLAQK